MMVCLTDGPICHQNDACKQKRLSDLVGLRRQKVARPVIFVGTGTCGLGAGAGKTLAAVNKFLADKSLQADVVEVGCIGLCVAEPMVDVQLPGKTRLSFKGVKADLVEGLLTGVLAGKVPTEMSLGQFRAPEGGDQQVWADVPYMDEHPFFAPQKRWVLANCGVIDPGRIEEYIARGGYSAMAKSLKGKTPADLCEIVEASGLRGRGGGGFPTGKKWKFALAAPGDQKYLVCNADEGDPGAFMDRAVIEGDPHRLLEGMGIAAYAIGATKAYVYIRAEYPLAIKRLIAAIAQAKEYGLLGHNVLGSGFNLDIIIKQGAGAFVCGEETALINSIEGKRGMPRPRPPFPAVRGLFDKPTVINNVETLANAPSNMPSMTRCGSPSSTERSMKAPGSPSSALQTRYFGVFCWARVSCHLRPVGKPPPPRPRSPAFSTSLSTISPLSPAASALASAPYPPRATYSSRASGSMRPQFCSTMRRWRTSTGRS